LEATRRQAEQMVVKGHQPLALCAPRVRMALRQLVERSIPTLVVLSYAEIAAGVGVESTGMVEVG
jgi:flagellar biosynthesis protein FlhA